MPRIELVDGLSWPELKEHIKEKRNELEAIDNIDRHCWSCSHLDRKGPPECRKFNATPPREFLNAGCDEWILEYIPF